jgi:hypothetical protein
MRISKSSKYSTKQKGVTFETIAPVGFLSEIMTIHGEKLAIK